MAQINDICRIVDIIILRNSKINNQIHYHHPQKGRIVIMLFFSWSI